MNEELNIDPTDFAKYALIEDVLNDKIYHNKKVRILGTIIQNDKDSNKIIIAHKDEKQNISKIECLVPAEYANVTEENHICQVIGTVLPSSPNPIIKAIIVKLLDVVDPKLYDFSLKLFNEYLFQ